MKKLLLIALGFAGFAAHASAQVSLALIDPDSDTSTVDVTAGGTFSLDIQISGPTSTPALDGFDVTMSGSPSSTTSLPTGITLTGYSNLVTGFFGGSDAPGHPNSYSAVALSSPSDDIDFSTTPITILVANFSVSGALAPGTYNIYFPPTGSFQNLYNASSTAIPYTAFDATIIVSSVPEPRITGLLELGFALCVGGVVSWKRRKPSY